jgi:hypothetical protein
VPVTDTIIKEEADFVLEVAGADDARQAEVMASAQAFRNLRGLFHAAIDAGALRRFQVQAIEAFAASEDGEAAWAMLRQKVIGFEAGRGRNDTDDATWRYIPANLEEAAQYYGGAQATEAVVQDFVSK